MTDVLWAPESHVEAVLRAEGPLTQPQLAHRVYGVPIHATGNVEEDRARTSAIRSVQEAIKSLRRRNVPVINTPAGMRIGMTADECDAEFQSLRSRIAEMSKTAWGLRRAARVLRAIEAGRLGEPEPVALSLWEAA